MRLASIAVALPLALIALTSSSYAQSESVLFSFDSYHARENGFDPIGVIEKDGVLFGVTTAGGVSDSSGGSYGLVYALTPPSTPGAQWSETVLYRFPKAPNGSVPNPLLAGANHTLYGTTAGEGTHAQGTVYSLAPPPNDGTPWVETTLYNFDGTSHVLSPNSALISDSSGTLYGVTFYGDGPCASDEFYPYCGGVFSLSPPSTPGGTWTERRLHSFSGGTTDGVEPNGPLTLGKNGVLYGVTLTGGAYHGGVVYSLTPPAAAGGAWTEQVLYSFTGKLDGALPNGPLIADQSGRLFGTCSHGGEPPGFGTVFELTPPSSPGGSWTEHTIWVFGVNLDDGGGPGFGLTQDNGVFYGVTTDTVFQLTPPSVSGNPWTETILHTFPDSATDAAFPSSSLLLTQSGTLYGTTNAGGANNSGTVYEVTP